MTATYTLSLRNNATGESVVSFTVSEQMYRYGDLGRVLNDCVGAIQQQVRRTAVLEKGLNGQLPWEAVVEQLNTSATPSAGFSEASASSGEEAK